ncbi:MAG TPA: winged helix DNA-binding domain-containing protein [Acidimicrobiia bacterium]|nr:winged helix DNA-binding domain-containing protein [Acidimicrobiia bacterium]
MALTPRQLNRATLARQLLLQRASLAVTDAVRRVVALQAQEPASPYLALWNRVDEFDPADLDASFHRHEVVKATLMRITLHAIHVDDYPSFHAAMQGTLRDARLNDRRFLQTGLSPDDAHGLVPHLRNFASKRRTKDEIEARLEDHLGDDPSWVWWALRHVGPFWHAPSDETWSFGRHPAYVAATTDGEHDRNRSVQSFIRRYLEGFGPASPQDVAQFAMLRQSDIRPALEPMTDLVEIEGPDGRVLLDLPDGEIPNDEASAPPRLMAMWDSTLLAYKDRSRIIPAEYRRVVIQRNGDVLPSVLVDGYVSGVWRAVDDGIEITAFHRLDDDDWNALATEAGALVAFLSDREPSVYSRYRRWWSDLPAAEVEVVPG